MIHLQCLDKATSRCLQRIKIIKNHNLKQNLLQKQYSQLYMAAKIKQDLHRMAESITINAHYPCNLGNLNILFQYEFYFDICQIIFPEFNIKLVKIKESDEFDAGQKMDKLITMLSSELEIDLSSIKGAEVIKGENISHVHRFLQFLEKFSQIHQANEKDDSGSRRVRSDPNTSGRMGDQRKIPRSARQKVQQQIINDSEDEQDHSKSQKKHKKGRKKEAPSYSTAKRQKRTRSETRKNLYSSLVNIMMNQKNRTIKASLRDNRKIKNQQIIEAKTKYKSYLIGFAKQNRAAKNREALRKPSGEQLNRQQLPIDDFENIQNFFKSFQLKLRDQKYCYLKRIEKMVRAQQMDRMCYLNKIQQQRNKEVKKSTKKEMDRIQNEHKLRRSLLKQEFESQKEANRLMKKQYQRYLRSQKKQLKENKKKELEKIQDLMKQENGKVLVSLQEGGRLEKVILDMYKRF